MPARRRPPAGSRTELPPLKIIRKILLLQAAYYVSATVLILFTTVVYGAPFSLDLVFGWDSLRGDTTIGWMLGLVWLLNCFIGVIFLLLFVSRSKLVPDFALTIHFLHLIATTLYTHSLPSNVLWWGLQFASAAMMTFLGMWACQRRELEPIKFGGHGGTQAGPSQTSDGDDQQESSFGRGRGRERSLQEYEMDDMKHMGEHAV
ncbi:hypothetical protein N7457_008465 [Penicillium paradoxum]|uniref:uncharacterized protein n=1 Tax=Penicillium paradoxum TaxID=176176 RepID=UPI0025497DD0|nr:uncharacterized protein N7457_008465 [Penicillium paradoxum]KAJ5773569.1 hypothetical protein N7457_008465 [Penicillium paradoxum]